MCLAVNATGTLAALGTGQRLLLVDLEKGELLRSDKDVAVTASAFGRGDVLALGLKGRLELRPVERGGDLLARDPGGGSSPGHRHSCQRARHGRGLHQHSLPQFRPP